MATWEMKNSACQGGTTKRKYGGSSMRRDQPLGSGWLTVIQRIWSLLVPLSADLGKMILWEADKQLNEKEGDKNWQEDLAPCPQPAHRLGSAGSRPVRPCRHLYQVGQAYLSTMSQPNHSTFRGSPFWALDPSIICRTSEFVVFWPECRMLVMQSWFALGSSFLELWPLGKVLLLDLIDPCYPNASGARSGF